MPPCSVILYKIGVRFQFESESIEHFFKWIRIAPKKNHKYHILVNTGSLSNLCMGAFPVGWNNQAAGASWQSWRQGMAEEVGSQSRIPTPLCWGLAYPCRASPSCHAQAWVLCCTLLQINNPVKGTNMLQKSHCCPACFCWQIYICRDKPQARGKCAQTSGERAYRLASRCPNYSVCCQSPFAMLFVIALLHTMPPWSGYQLSNDAERLWGQLQYQRLFRPVCEKQKRKRFCYFPRSLSKDTHDKFNARIGRAEKWKTLL